MKSYMAHADQVDARWYVVDAAGVPLGRLATELARRLRGKHKTVYTPHVDTGDFVIVLHAGEVLLTGRKKSEKRYHHHSGYIGGLKTVTFEEMRARHPERIIEEAVRGMLPKNPLGRAMIRKLKVYAGGRHPHAAQTPKALTIGKAPARAARLS
jgi:large subunit ribosomal protein L13